MIKVNLAGIPRKKSAAAKKKGPAISLSASLMMYIHIIIVLGALGGGYYWYSSLTAQTDGLTNQITAANAEKASLENVIKQMSIYEGRKKTLENRVKLIEDLRNGQTSPVLTLDVLAEVIGRTEYVWLTSFEQNFATVTMNGVGTSVNAIAAFVQNMERTGYFRNVNVANLTDSSGNVTFGLTCEFQPPASAAPPAPAGKSN